MVVATRLISLLTVAALLVTGLLAPLEFDAPTPDAEPSAVGARSLDLRGVEGSSDALEMLEERIDPEVVAWTLSEPEMDDFRNVMDDALARPVGGHVLLPWSSMEAEQQVAAVRALVAEDDAADPLVQSAGWADVILAKHVVFEMYKSRMAREAHNIVLDEMEGIMAGHADTWGSMQVDRESVGSDLDMTDVVHPVEVLPGGRLGREKSVGLAIHPSGGTPTCTESTKEEKENGTFYTTDVCAGESGWADWVLNPVISVPLPLLKGRISTHLDNVDNITEIHITLKRQTLLTKTNITLESWVLGPGNSTENGTLVDVLPAIGANYPGKYMLESYAVNKSGNVSRPHVFEFDVISLPKHILAIAAAKSGLNWTMERLELNPEDLPFLPVGSMVTIDAPPYEPITVGFDRNMGLSNSKDLLDKVPSWAKKGAGGVAKRLPCMNGPTSATLDYSGGWTTEIQMVIDPFNGTGDPITGKWIDVFYFEMGFSYLGLTVSGNVSGTVEANVGSHGWGPSGFTIDVSMAGALHCDLMDFFWGKLPVKSSTKAKIQKAVNEYAMVEALVEVELALGAGITSSTDGANVLGMSVTELHGSLTISVKARGSISVSVMKASVGIEAEAYGQLGLNAHLTYANATAENYGFSASVCPCYAYLKLSFKAFFFKWSKSFKVEQSDSVSIIDWPQAPSAGSSLFPLNTTATLLVLPGARIELPTTTTSTPGHIVDGLPTDRGAIALTADPLGGFHLAYDTEDIPQMLADSINLYAANYTCDGTFEDCRAKAKTYFIDSGFLASVSAALAGADQIGMASSGGGTWSLAPSLGDPMLPDRVPDMARATMPTPPGMPEAIAVWEQMPWAPPLDSDPFPFILPPHIVYAHYSALFGWTPSQPVDPLHYLGIGPKAFMSENGHLAAVTWLRDMDGDVTTTGDRWPMVRVFVDGVALNPRAVNTLGRYFEAPEILFLPNDLMLAAWAHGANTVPGDGKKGLDHEWGHIKKYHPWENYTHTARIEVSLGQAIDSLDPTYSRWFPPLYRGFETCGTNAWMPRMVFDNAGLTLAWLERDLNYTRLVQKTAVALPWDNIGPWLNPNSTTFGPTEVIRTTPELPPPEETLIMTRENVTQNVTMGWNPPRHSYRDLQLVSHEDGVRTFVWIDEDKDQVLRIEDYAMDRHLLQLDLFPRTDLPYAPVPEVGVCKRPWMVNYTGDFPPDQNDPIAWPPEQYTNNTLKVPHRSDYVDAVAPPPRMVADIPAVDISSAVDPIQGGVATAILARDEPGEPGFVQWDYRPLAFDFDVEVEVSPANPAPGSVAVLTATVTNIGNIPSVPAHVVFGGDGMDDTPLLVDVLMPRESLTLSAPWTVEAKTTPSVGFARVESLLGGAADGSVGNNEATVRNGNDLSVVFDRIYNEESDMVVAFTIHNTGVLPAASPVVYLDTLDGGAVASAVYPVTVAAGGQQTVQLTVPKSWLTPGHSDYVLEVWHPWDVVDSNDDAVFPAYVRP